MLLLVSTRPPLPVPALPLLFDFFFADLEIVIRRLAAAGVRYEHRGHPEHALGGEVRVSDPDGNTVLLSQRAAAAPGGTPDATAAVPFSLLREAAAAVAAQDLETVRCEAAGPGSGAVPGDGGSETGGFRRRRGLGLPGARRGDPHLGTGRVHRQPRRPRHRCISGAALLCRARTASR